MHSAKIKHDHLDQDVRPQPMRDGKREAEADSVSAKKRTESKKRPDATSRPQKSRKLVAGYEWEKYRAELPAVVGMLTFSVDSVPFVYVCNLCTLSESLGGIDVFHTPPASGPPISVDHSVKESFVNISAQAVGLDKGGSVDSVDDNDVRRLTRREGQTGVMNTESGKIDRKRFDIPSKSLENPTEHEGGLLEPPRQREDAVIRNSPFSERERAFKDMTQALKKKVCVDAT